VPVPETTETVASDSGRGASSTVPTMAPGTRPCVSSSRSSHALATYRFSTFIDVREKAQYDDLHIKGALNVPLGVMPARLAEISRKGLLVLY
jgi:hypothetical protein